MSGTLEAVPNTTSDGARPTVSVTVTVPTEIYDAIMAEYLALDPAEIEAQNVELRAIGVDTDATHPVSDALGGYLALGFELRHLMGAF